VDYPRVYPGGTLQSKFNVRYRVAARLQDPQAQAVAERYASFGHSNLEEYWTLLWRDPSIKAASMSSMPLSHAFQDSGVIYMRTSWATNATAIAFKAGPPEGHRVTAMLSRIPEWRLDSGHSHPDAGSFIIWANGRYVTGDTGYAGLPSARNHNTVTFGGVGQGVKSQHDVWRDMPVQALDGIRVREATVTGSKIRIVADLAAAYPDRAGVTTFTRTFTWDGASTITIADAATLKSPKTAEWYLQSDTPLKNEGNSAFRVSFAAPQGVAITTGAATVKSPGPPGSIEKGPEEQRGYALKATAPAAINVAFSVTLQLISP